MDGGRPLGRTLADTAPQSTTALRDFALFTTETGEPAAVVLY
jgi:hypothetical protein